jgi:hypothetical protein
MGIYIVLKRRFSIVRYDTCACDCGAGAGPVRDVESPSYCHTTEVRSRE